jgi:hypothetical protein
MVKLESRPKEQLMTFNSGLIGSPINGQILERWGYLGISLFSGLAMIIGVVIMAIARLRANPKLLSIA